MIATEWACPKVCVGCPSNSTWRIWEVVDLAWANFGSPNFEGTSRFYSPGGGCSQYIHIISHISLLLRLSIQSIHVFNEITIVAEKLRSFNARLGLLDVEPLWKQWDADPRWSCGPNDQQSRSLPWFGVDSFHGFSSFTSLMMLEAKLIYAEFCW